MTPDRQPTRKRARRLSRGVQATLWLVAAVAFLFLSPMGPKNVLDITVPLHLSQLLGYFHTLVFAALVVLFIWTMIRPPNNRDY